MNKYSQQKGFMMVEIIIVASIVVVFVLGAMAVAQKSISLSRQSLHVSQANFLLDEGAESVRIVRDNAWSNITSLTSGANYYPTFSGGTWTLSSTSNTVGNFTRKVMVENVNRNNSTQDIAASGTNDPNTKLVTVTVTWTEGATSMARTISFYITNIFS
jgi:Tfp pilus assembly protein PilV